MKAIPLTQGKVALVDAADFDWLNQFNWCAYFNGRHWYAKRGERPRTTMHRLILNPPEGMDSDHINRDGLDNRRINLRVCNRSQNMQNSISRTGLSRFKGVVWHKQHNKWMAHIRLNRKRIHLSYFTSEVEAAQAYNKAAVKYYGEFARLNDV